MRSWLLIFAVILGMSSVGRTAEFGFDYWPRGFSGDIFFDANWSTHRADVAHDLDVIRALGGTTIRLMFWPEQSGFQLTANADSMSDQYRQMFSNSYLLYGPDQPVKIKWWNVKYGGHENLNKFLIDSGRWITGLAVASETSSFAASVLYYDIQNEYTPSWPDMQEYVTAMARLPAIPAAKLGISILYGATDVDTLRSLATANRTDFRFVDFHVYPDEKGGGFNMNLEEIHQDLQTNFPRATVLIGELGYKAATPAEQNAQASAMISILDRATANNIPYVLGWSLYEDSGQPKMQMGNGMGVFDNAGQPKVVARILNSRAVGAVRH
jgi:hypothetical protein